MTRDEQESICGNIITIQSKVGIVKTSIDPEYDYDAFKMCERIIIDLEILKARIRCTS